MAWYVNAAAILAAAATVMVLLNSRGGDLLKERKTELMTRQEVDSVVSGCKWWYCKQGAGDRRVRRYATGTEHPGYSVQEVDNLPAGEQRAISPYMTRMMGAYTSRTPVATQVVNLALSQQPGTVPGASQEHIEERLAAEAAANNMPVTVSPYQSIPVPLSASSSSFFNLAQRSLHALITPTAQLSNSGAAGWGTDAVTAPRMLSAPTQQLAMAPGGAQSRASDASSNVDAIRSRLGQATANLAKLQLRVVQSDVDSQAGKGPSQESLRGGRLQSLSELEDAGGDEEGEGNPASMDKVAEGGQAYMVGLEAKLADAEMRTKEAKKVVDALNAPHSETFQVGNADSAQSGASLAQHSAVVMNSPTGAAPFVYPGVSSTQGTYTFQGAGYPVQSSDPFSSIYGAFQNYGPMQRWAEEDSAEHAYNLNSWRKQILQAKIEQAKLRQKLMASENSIERLDTGAEPTVGGAADGWRRDSAGGGGGVKKDVMNLKIMLASVAEETSSALESLAEQVKSVAAKTASLRGGRSALAVTSFLRERKMPERRVLGGTKHSENRSTDQQLQNRARRVRVADGNLGQEVKREMSALTSALANIELRRGHGRGPRGGRIDSPTGVVSLQQKGMGVERIRIKTAEKSRALLKRELQRDMEALKISRSN